MAGDFSVNSCGCRLLRVVKAHMLHYVGICEAMLAFNRPNISKFETYPELNWIVSAYWRDETALSLIQSNLSIRHERFRWATKIWRSVLFFVTAWYKKICARKNGCWREISVRDECSTKTVLRVLCCCSACCLLQGKFSEKFKCLVKCNLCSCKSSSRWFKFSNFQRNFTKTYVPACFNVRNKGKCWVTSRCVFRIGGIWLSGEIVHRQMKNTTG